MNWSGSNQERSRRSPWITAFACALALFVAPLSVTQAAWVVVGFAAGEAEDEEAFVIRWMDPETGVSYVEAVYKDGSKAYWPDNPNPDSGTTSPGDNEMRMSLLKQAGGLGYLEPSWQKTPLGAALADKGPGHYHNPSDDEDYGGVSPSKIEFFDPRDVYEEMMTGGVSSGVNLDGNGGSLGGQLEDAIRRGTKGDNDDNDDGARPSDGGFWGDDLPGPPELVNPAWSELEWELYLLELEAASR